MVTEIILMILHLLQALTPAGQSGNLYWPSKGKTTKENIRRNFGMPKPEGYRKALRIMKLAEHYSIPITFIDTPEHTLGLELKKGNLKLLEKTLCL